MNQDELEAWIADMIPDLTFQEAFERSGRYINISVASSERHHKGRLLNAITSPSVLVRQAILASCAVPGMYQPVMLMARDDAGHTVPYLPERRWIDGSVSHDLPTRRLSRLYGVNHTIVSQANPLVLPFASESKQAYSVTQAFMRATLQTAKTWFNLQMRLLERPLSVFPSLLAATQTVQSMINQEYSGDINVILPPFLFPPHKLLSVLSLSEIERLVHKGEKATWPKIEMVRLQTLISRVLAPIVAGYDNNAIGRDLQNNKICT
jgi:NTE family protein